MNESLLPVEVSWEPYVLINNTINLDKKVVTIPRELMNVITKLVLSFAYENGAGMLADAVSLTVVIALMKENEVLATRVMRVVSQPPAEISP